MEGSAAVSAQLQQREQALAIRHSFPQTDSDGGLELLGQAYKDGGWASMQAMLVAQSDSDFIRGGGMGRSRGFGRGFAGQGQDDLCLLYTSP
ncbi:MAG: hypothetical protein N3A60_13150, partial [Thermanaerothrix sp.]|nr:hypothetical protein [Thermanaerothrix sp.]